MDVSFDSWRTESWKVAFVDKDLVVCDLREVHDERYIIVTYDCCSLHVAITCLVRLEQLNQGCGVGGRTSDSDLSKISDSNSLA